MAKVPSDFPWRALAVSAALLLFAWLCIGCSTTERAPNAPTPAAPTRQESADLVSGHAAKDGKVKAEADNIDRKVAGTAVAAAVKVSTDAQRSAVDAAPAAQIAELVARYDAFAASVNALLADKDKSIDRLSKQVAALQDAELRAQVRTMRWFGFGCLLAAVALGYARQIGFAAASAGLGALSLGAAQVWASVASHPWFKPTLGGALVVGLVGLVWAAVHAYKKGDLTTKALRERDRLKETLKVLVPAIDDAKQEMGDALKPLLGRLSSKMDWEDKQTVKVVRHEAALE